MNPIISKLQISEGLLIASVPVIGYTAAYFYQLGKYVFLKVPSFMIELRIESAIFSTILTAFIMIVFGIAIYVAFILPIPSHPERPIQKNSFKKSIILFPIIICIFVIFILSISIFSMLLKVVILSMSIIFMTIVVFVPPLIDFPAEKNYITKFDLHAEKLYKKQLEQLNEKKKPITIITFFLNSPGLTYIIYASFIAIWIALAYSLGFYELRQQYTYPVSFQNQKNYIIVGKYTDYLILVELDTKNRVTTNNIVLKPSNEQIEIQQTKIGLINQ